MEESAELEYWKVREAEAGMSLCKGAAVGILLQVSGGLGPALKGMIG